MDKNKYSDILGKHIENLFYKFEIRMFIPGEAIGTHPQGRAIFRIWQNSEGYYYDFDSKESTGI